MQWKSTIKALEVEAYRRVFFRTHNRGKAWNQSLLTIAAVQHGDIKNRVALLGEWWSGGIAEYTEYTEYSKIWNTWNILKHGKYYVFLLVVNELVLLATPIGGQTGPL